MAKVGLRGTTLNTVGELPSVGSPCPDFELTAADLSSITLGHFSGKRLVINIFPSIDTPTCASSVRRFNENASRLENTVVLCVSADLPFALSRFCGAEGLSNVVVGSCFRSNFGQHFGVTLTDGPMRGLLSRCVVVVDANGVVLHTEQVSELSNEPDYDAALAVL